MLSIQDAGRSILSGSPGKFYVFGGCEYGVKLRYLRILSEHYKGNIVEASSVEYVLTKMSHTSIIPTPDTLYIVRYDEHFLSNLSESLASDIESANIAGTLVCIYQDKRHVSKCEKYLPNYTVSFDPVSSGFIRKYLVSDFPDIDSDIIEFALNIHSDYIAAHNICYVLSYADPSVIMRYGQDSVSGVIGSKDVFSDEKFKLCIAARSFKFALAELDIYEGDFNLLLYAILNVMVELERVLSCPKTKSIYGKYAKSWNLDDVYNMFSIVYDWIKRSRGGTSVNLYNVIVSILASLQFSPIVYVG